MGIGAVVILTAMCATAGGKPQRDEVAFTVIEEGSSPGYPSDPMIRVLDGGPGYRSFYRRVHSGRVPPPEPPAVDLEEDLVIFVSSGEKRTAGHAIQVREVFTRDDLLVVQAVMITPPEGGFQAQVITHPYALLAVERSILEERSILRVELRNDRGEVLARGRVAG
ncbi:MAG: protease complex subunit PrcB family protein [Spirochaetota bacterium]